MNRMQVINAFRGMIVMFLLLVSVQVNAENCTSIYKVTATQLNVRSQASTQGNVIGTLHKGDQICISQENGNWGKTNAGWVSKKHLAFIDNTSSNSNYVASTSQNSTSSDNSGLIAIIIFIIIISIVFFLLKNLFYHTIIRFGMAEPDGRSKSGIRLTRLGKFMRGISGLVIFVLFLIFMSTSK